MLFREWVGFQKSYVIFRVGHGKCLRPITRWVGGVKKGQKHAYVIFEWSLSYQFHFFLNYWLISKRIIISESKIRRNDNFVAFHGHL